MAWELYDALVYGSCIHVPPDGWVDNAAHVSSDTHSRRPECTGKRASIGRGRHEPRECFTPHPPPLPYFRAPSSPFAACWRITAFCPSFSIRLRTRVGGGQRGRGRHDVPATAATAATRRRNERRGQQKGGRRGRHGGLRGGRRGRGARSAPPWPAPPRARERCLCMGRRARAQRRCGRRGGQHDGRRGGRRGRGTRSVPLWPVPPRARERCSHRGRRARAHSWCGRGGGHRSPPCMAAAGGGARYAPP